MSIPRREVLARAAGGLAIIASGLSAKSLLNFFEQETALDEYPPPRVIDPDNEDWGSFTVNDDRSVSVTLADDSDTLVRRVLDPESAAVKDTAEIAHDSDEITIDRADSDGIEMIYRRPEDGHLEYLFDMPVSSSITRDIRDSAGYQQYEYYSRSFDEQWIAVSVQLWDSGEPTTTINVPYSLYVHAAENNPTGPIPTTVSASDNGFDRYDHNLMIDAISETLDSILDVDDSPYWKAASIAELVQLIPHATDWESRGKLHYIRTPAEMLVELTADCKDAAVLLYHLLNRFGYDPVFILLVGNVAGDQLGGDEKKEKKTEDSGEKKSANEVKGPPDDVSLYPNHIAIGVPIDQLEPIPDDEIDEVTTFERDGQDYVYIESTHRTLPGEYQDPQGRTKSVVYESNQDMLRELLPL